MVIEIDDKLVNLDKIHFVRKESDSKLLVSFGTDFIRFKGSPKYIGSIYNILQAKSNEKLPCND